MNEPENKGARHGQLFLIHSQAAKSCAVKRKLDQRHVSVDETFARSWQTMNLKSLRPAVPDRQSRPPSASWKRPLSFGYLKPLPR